MSSKSMTFSINVIFTSLFGFKQETERREERRRKEKQPDEFNGISHWCCGCICNNVKMLLVKQISCLFSSSSPWFLSYKVLYSNVNHLASHFHPFGCGRTQPHCRRCARVRVCVFVCFNLFSVFALASERWGLCLSLSRLELIRRGLAEGVDTIHCYDVL